MLNIIIGALKVIVLLGTLIVIHEFGHFVMAKLFKIKVHKFSIGFGPKLLNKKGKETEYSLRLIPLGGFVQLEGEDENSDDPRSFSKKPIWQRILVIIAGVVVNISFAIIIYLSIYMNINYYVLPIISEKTDANYLAQYGLEVGDTIASVDGKKVYNDYDIDIITSNSNKDTFLFTIVRKDGSKTFKNIKFDIVEEGFVGAAFNLDGSIALVISGSASEKAGLKAKDLITHINGVEYNNVNDIISTIKKNGGKELYLTVLRDEKEKEIVVTPKLVRNKAINFEYEEVKNADFFENLSLAWNETKSYLRANIEGALGLLRGETENVEFTGIVGISNEITKTESALDFFYLMSAISLSLGIMNLLPIPGLDGGKILICIIEAIRGKPMNKAVEGALTLISFCILIFLMIYVTIGDISKLFG